MAARALDIGPAGIRFARNIEIPRAERGLPQRMLAAHFTVLGRPMPNTMLSRIERTQRRCDIDDLVAIAQALHVPVPALLRGPATACTRLRHPDPYPPKPHLQNCRPASAPSEEPPPLRPPAIPPARFCLQRAPKEVITHG